jgi:hypothetical protein
MILSVEIRMNESHVYHTVQRKVSTNSPKVKRVYTETAMSNPYRTTSMIGFIKSFKFSRAWK